jgi:ubiquitin-protein ligase
MLANRMAFELKLLEREPPPGACAWPIGDSITELRATLLGPEGTVYEHGSFGLSISLPDR